MPSTKNHRGGPRCGNENVSPQRNSRATSASPKDARLESVCEEEEYADSRGSRGGCLAPHHHHTTDPHLTDALMESWMRRIRQESAHGRAPAVDAPTTSAAGAVTDASATASASSAAGARPPCVRPRCRARRHWLRKAAAQNQRLWLVLCLREWKEMVMEGRLQRAAEAAAAPREEAVAATTETALRGQLDWERRTAVSAMEAAEAAAAEAAEDVAELEARTEEAEARAEEAEAQLRRLGGSTRATEAEALARAEAEARATAAEAAAAAAERRAKAAEASVARAREARERAAGDALEHAERRAAQAERRAEAAEAAAATLRAELSAASISTQGPQGKEANAAEEALAGEAAQQGTAPDSSADLSAALAAEAAATRRVSDLESEVATARAALRVARGALGSAETAELAKQALLVACRRGDARAGVVALELCADVIDAVGPVGATPLHAAARYGHAHVVRMLLRRGADHTLRDGRGLAPLEVARLWRHEACVAALINC